MSIGGSDFSVEGRIEINLIARGMDAAARSLAGIAAQSEKAAASLRKVAAGFDAVGAKSRAIGQNLTIGVTAPILGLGALAVNAASDLNEAANLTQKAFGDSAQAIVDWSTTTADSLGISQAAALQTAAQFGSLFQAAGQTANQAAQQAQDVIRLGADLASAFNKDPAEALAAIRSGLAGESEPMKAFNVFLTETEVNLEAVRLGLASTTGEVSEQAKVMARLSLIQKQSSMFAGDFADTQDELANVTRRLKAQLIDTAAAIGAELLPPVLKAVQGFKALVERFQALSPSIRQIVVVLALIAAGIGPAIFAFGLFASTVGTLVGAFAFLLSPLGLVLTAIAALAIVFRGPLGRAVKFVVNAFKPLANAFRAAFIAGVGVDKLVEFLPERFAELERPILVIVDTLGDLWRAFQAGGLQGFWEQLTIGGEANLIKRSLGEIVAAFLNLAATIPWGRIATALGTALAGAVVAAVPWLLAELRGLASAVGETVASAIGGIPWGDIVSGFGDLAGVLWTAIEVAFGAIDWAGLWEIAETGISAAAGTAIEVGRILLVGDVEIEDRGGNVEDTGSSFAALVADAIRSSGILLQAAGAFIMQSVAIGLGAALGALAGLIVTAVVGLFALVIAAARDPGRAAQIVNALLNPITAVFGTVDWLGIAGDFVGAFAAAFGLTTPDALVQAGVDLITGLIDGVAARWNDLVHFLGDLARNLPGYLGAAPNALFNVGYNLITGLINGIAARWNDLVHFLGDLASHLPDWVAGPLGIHSPSTVFMALGADTAAGFGVGFRDAWRHVEASLATGARSLATTVVAPPAPRFAPAMAGARTVQAGGVTITVNGAGDPNAVADRVYRSLDAAFGRLELESRR